MWYHSIWMIVQLMCSLAPSISGWYANESFTLTLVRRCNALQKRNTKSLSQLEYVRWQTILAVPVHEEQCNKIFSGDVSATRYETNVGAKVACHCCNTVKAFIFGKLSHEIDGNALTTAVRHEQWVERVGGFDIKCLVPLTGITRQDIQVL